MVDSTDPFFEDIRSDGARTRLGHAGSDKQDLSNSEKFIESRFNAMCCWLKDTARPGLGQLSAA
jgi:hypothetical protein